MLEIKAHHKIIKMFHLNKFRLINNEKISACSIKNETKVSIYLLNILKYAVLILYISLYINITFKYIDIYLDII